MNALEHLRIGTRLALAFALVARSVMRPVGSTVAALKTVAAVDLTVHVSADRRDDIAELQQALARAVATLRRLVGDVRAGIHSATTASGQIGAGPGALARRGQAGRHPYRQARRGRPGLDIV